MTENLAHKKNRHLTKPVETIFLTGGKIKKKKEKKAKENAESLFTL